MKIRWKILTGCVFMVGLAGGLLVAMLAWWFLSPGAETAGTGISATANPEAGAAGTANLDPYQKIILDDPELLAKLEKLCEIPEIRDVLDDDEITKAITDKNYLALLRNRKIRDAASHPAMRELTALIIKRRIAGAFQSSPGKTTPETKPGAE